MSSDGIKAKLRDVCEESVEADSANDRSEESNDIDKEERRKLLNKIRCQRYRYKKKIKDASKNTNPATITVEEKEKIERQKERSKLKSKRYRDRKRMNLLNLRLDQSSGIIVKHDSKNFHNSQIAGPSTTHMPDFPSTQTAGPSTLNEEHVPESHSSSDDEIYNDFPLEVQINDGPELSGLKSTNCEQNTQNVNPNHVQNNKQTIDFQHYLPVQTKSTFLQISHAHLELKKKFIDNNFGHACDICDRLLFKSDLNFFLNNDATPCIKLIRKMLPNLNLSEVKICLSCLRMIKSNRVPALSVYNGCKSSISRKTKNKTATPSH